MDFMFEDEVDEVGSDVEAYCPKCKADTTHVVISKYEDEIRRVQCNPCGDVHSFRKPRGEVEDDVPEPIAAKKRAMMKKPNWEEYFAKHGEKAGKPYEFREHYSENAIVTHPKFGRGFVSEVMSDSKVEITFKDARRVLVHNRKDMPGLPLAAEGDGIPSNGAKAKAVKSKAAKEERVAAKTAMPTGTPTAGPSKVDAAPKPEAKAESKSGPPKAPVKGAKPATPVAKLATPSAKPATPVAAPKAESKKHVPPRPVAKTAAKPAPKPQKSKGSGHHSQKTAMTKTAKAAKKPAKKSR